MPKTHEPVELEAVFAIERGNKLDLNKMERAGPADGGVVFVGRSGQRGGFGGWVRPLADVAPYPAGLITVALGGSALASFVQARPFYTAQNIDVLVPRAPMSLEEKLYYCLCIEANRFRYVPFGREANRTLRTLRVPARASVPAWVRGAADAALDELCRDLRDLPRA